MVTGGFGGWCCGVPSLDEPDRAGLEDTGAPTMAWFQPVWSLLDYMTGAHARSVPAVHSFVTGATSPRFVAEQQHDAQPHGHLFIYCYTVAHAGADLLPGAAGAATPGAASQVVAATTSATTSTTPQNRQHQHQHQQQQQQQQQQQCRKSSRSPRKAAVEYAAIVTIPPGVVPGQAMQVQLVDGRCVVVQV